MLNVQHSANAIYLLLSIICFVVWLIHRHHPLSWHEKKIPFYLIAAFLIYPLALFVQSIVMGKWSMRAWDIPSRFILAIPILYFLATLEVRRLVNVFNFAVLGVWIALVGSLYQLGVSPDGRATTYFMHPTSFGNLVWILGILSLGAYRGAWFQRLWAISGFMASLLAAYASGTRAAWLAAIVAMVVGVLLHTQVSKKMKYVILMFLCVMVLSLYAGLSSVRDRVNIGWYELTQPLATVSDSSVGLRRQYWKASMLMIQEHPIVGVGRFQFVKEKQRLVDEGTLTMAATQYAHPHNELLFAWVELGLLGLLGIFSLYLAPAYFFWKHRISQDETTCSMALLGLMVVVSYVVFGCMDVMMTAWVMQAPIYVMSIVMPILVIVSRKRSLL